MWYSNLGEKIYFLTYHPPTLIALPLRRNPKHRSLLSQQLPHLRFNLFVISETLATFLEPDVNCFTRQTLPTVKRKDIFMYILSLSPSAHKEKTHKKTLLLCNTLKHGRHFDYWNQPLNMHTRLLRILSWSWTVLLPSDTHRKPITTITGVLLPFVTYSLQSTMSLDQCSTLY
jgi:hypothetical protein